MIKAIKQFFSAFSMLFGAAERGASAVNELAIWAEEEARNMRIQAQKEREQQLKDAESDPEEK